MKILFIFPYPTGRAASQRFRFEQYLEILESQGHEFHPSPFLNERSWNKFYKKGFVFMKGLALLQGFLRRFWDLLNLWKYDLAFIHREATPIGPPIFEWAATHVLKKKIIFDFDDAIWIANSSESNRFFAPLKWHSNFFKICSWAHKISAGNQFLKNTAEEYGKNVVVNPTTIDTIHLHNKIKVHDPKEKIVIGWTGSHSTVKYLKPIFPVLSRLREKFDFEVFVISDEPPPFNQEEFKFIPWSKETEIQDLCRLNIGIMPLTKDLWSEGKCGFKALQYMALGIPALVSPVGVNEEIVDHGINGFICRNDDEWYQYLSQLMDNFDQLNTMGANARKKIETAYSVSSNEANFLHLLT